MEDVTPRVQLPWPYQMVEITVGKSDDAQQKLFPDSKDKSESVTRGYKIFKQSCIMPVIPPEPAFILGGFLIERTQKISWSMKTENF